MDQGGWGLSPSSTQLYTSQLHVDAQSELLLTGCLWTGQCWNLALTNHMPLAQCCCSVAQCSGQSAGPGVCGSVETKTYTSSSPLNYRQAGCSGSRGPSLLAGHMLDPCSPTSLCQNGRLVFSGLQGITEGPVVELAVLTGAKCGTPRCVCAGLCL